jgi:4-hydroxy-3-polyprenylbenzoate decarboxylase
MDGGAFVTLPQVYTEDAEKPGIGNANLGMYRIQLSGNDYILNKEIGLHYQLHRGIGVHQTKANLKGQPLKVSCFVGGPPAHSVAAVMPLPEGMSEMNFAGVLAGKRFGYTYKDGFCISTDADFVITGEVYPGENKPEGPFGDHLGYYSLQHPFPLMKVHKVYARKNAIWAFTVVGRPPQEDTSFGELIHAMTGDAVSNEIPGVKEVHAVDAAGVHPLLLAIGSERYTPFLDNKAPAELLTIANHILGTGQLSLAKFVWITAPQTKKGEQLSTHNVPAFFKYMMERMDLKRDVHFYTKTTMDTLDYSGEGLNEGSKVVMAAYGDPKRTLCETVPSLISNHLENATCVMPGVIAINAQNNSISSIQEKLKGLGDALLNQEGVFMLVITEDATWMAANIQNFLWAGFTRVNPSHDIDGVDAFVEHKHWGCQGPMIFDATIKKHHAPPVLKDATVEKRVDALLAKYGY